MQLNTSQRARLRLRARHALWRRGDLSRKLTPSSLQVYREIQAAPRLSTYVQESSRKVGKSFLALCWAFELCILNPGKRVNYAVSTGKAATEIVVPLVGQVAKDAPPELTPVYNQNSGHITFPKDGPAEGAHIVLFGCENQLTADRGRGPEAVGNIIDEAGFVPMLTYVMIEVLKPQLIYTKGKTLVLSSPPLSQGHEFCTVADAARARGLYSHRNVYTPGGLFTSPEEIEEYIASFAADLGIPVEQFRKSSAFKREVLGQRCIDERLAVVPEFSEVEHDTVERSPVTGEEVALKGIVRQSYPRPPGFMHVDRYVSLDPGMSDFSGGLFAYNDFLAGGIIVVEDDFLLANANTRTLAETVDTREKELWPGLKVRSRVVDDPGLRLVADFSNEHKQAWSPAFKPEREEAINLLRLVVGGRKMVILPKAANFIRQLRHAVRTKPGGDMARSETEGHFDLVAAGWYLTRTVDRQRNPYPRDWDMAPHLHRVGGVGLNPHPLATAFLGGTPLGRRVLRRKR